MSQAEERYIAKICEKNQSILNKKDTLLSVLRSRNIVCLGQLCAQLDVCYQCT